DLAHQRIFDFFNPHAADHASDERGVRVHRGRLREEGFDVVAAFDLLPQPGRVVTRQPADDLVDLVPCPALSLHLLHVQGTDAREAYPGDSMLLHSTRACPSAPASATEYRFQHPETSRVGIQLHFTADRNDELPVDVPDHRTTVGGDAQRLDVVVEDLVQGQRTVAATRIAVCTFAEDETGDLVQHAHQLERGEHAVDAVWRLGHVLQEQDPVLEVGQ